MAPNGAWEIEGEPYTTAPGSAFRWFRSRIEGGRTNHWGRIALRFAPADFKSCSTDGMGDAWPITYEDLAPYYDKVESYIGVFGSAASREWAKHWYDEIMPFLARNQVSRGAWRKTLG
jgi:choline dehydrogenase-like flavoprotein